MATTYSTSLKLALIGDGDQSGIWGQTTNTNLGALLEQAITGVQSITMIDANYTLTNFNGTLDEARNAVLVVTGTNNAVRDLIPPLVEKLYTVVNNTTGGYAIRVIGSSGTGVNIPNGTACLIYCDGTNFYAGLSGTSGSFSVNGNLGVTGTTTLTGATTLSNTLAVTGTSTFTGIPSGPTAAPGTNTTQLATTAFVTAALQAAYPVGSIYINATSSSNPNTLLGFGTWTAFGAGRVMVGLDAGDPLFDTAEETGGSKDAVLVSHTHTATSSVSDPTHSHGTGAGGNFALFNGGTSTASSVGGSNLGIVSTTGAASTGITVATTNSTEGSSGTNANIQPYITVRMWKRTA